MKLPFKSPLHAPVRVVSSLLSHPAASDSRLGPLSRFVRWQATKRLWPEPVIAEVFGGARLVCYPNSNAASAVLYFGLPDWNEMKLLGKVLQSGDGFIDVGANVGTYTLFAAQYVGPGRLIAIEPEPRNYERLRENVSLNGMNVEAHAVLASDTNGELSFKLGADTVGKVVAEGGDPIAARTLDSLVGPVGTGDFVAKVDVEGHELQVLRGATQLLASGRLKCMILETNAAADNVIRTELHDLLLGVGYHLYEVSGGGNRLSELRLGGPYPDNSVALCDLDWLRARASGVQIVAPSEAV